MHMRPVSHPLRALVVLPLLITMAACGDDAIGPEEVVLQDPAELTFASSLGVDLASMQRQSSGLYIKDLQPGTGDPTVAGDVMVVDYDGWVHDGTLFDSSRNAGREPFTLVAGEAGVIDGWREGLVGMRMGGLRQLVIPPQLAYGAQSPSPLIPAGSVLIFNVELLEVNPGS